MSIRARIVLFSSIFFISSFLFFVPALAQYETVDFSDPASCARCHPDIHKQWTKSLHAQSYSDPLFTKILDEAPIKEFCLDCHTPIGNLTDDIPPKTILSQMGISCDFCHTVTGATGIGNSSYVVDPGNTKRGPYKDSSSPAHDTAYSEFHTKSEFCGMCHDVYHPINKLPLETTYTEWKNGPYSAQGVQCQHCMMDTASDQPIATNGPIRTTVRTHEFAGGNFAFGSKENVHKRLKSAAKVELVIDKSKAKPGDNIGVTAYVTNVGAGHSIPTGLTELREMWLEIKAVDSAGRENSVYKQRYWVVLEDEKGIHDGHVPVWQAVKVYSDNRIAPKERRAEKATFTVPQKAQESLIVVALLNYRSAPQELTDRLGLEPMPTFEMASARETIELPKPPSSSSGWLRGLLIITGIIILVGATLVVYRLRLK